MLSVLPRGLLTPIPAPVSSPAPAPAPSLAVATATSSAATSKAAAVSAAAITKTPFLGIRTFVEKSQLFQYVKDKKAAIERLEAVASKPTTPKKLAYLIQILNDGPLTIHDPIFRDPDIYDLTVLAHITGKIEDYQLGTVFYWKSAFQRFAPTGTILREVPLFLPDGKVNPEAKKLMKETVKAAPGHYNQPILTEKELDDWFQAMAVMPASEQRLLIGEMDHTQAKMNAHNAGVAFLFPSMGDSHKSLATAYYTNKPNEQPTIMDAVAIIADCNLFNTVICKDKVCQLIPSTGMAETLFDTAKGGGHAKMVYRFGSGRTLRENGLNGERDITLRNPYQLTPTTADTFPAPKDEYTSHDLVYHGYTVNFVPLEHQKLFIEVGDLFAKEDPELADRFYDMECDVYRPERREMVLSVVNNTDADAFVHTIKHNVRNTLVRKFIAQFKTIYGSKALTQSEKEKQALNLIEEHRKNLGKMGVLQKEALKKIMGHLDKKPAKSEFERLLLKVSSIGLTLD